MEAPYHQLLLQVLSLENQALPDDALLVGCGVEDN